MRACISYFIQGIELERKVGRGEGKEVALKYNRNIDIETHRFPLKSSNFPFIYHNTDGSGIPRGGVQFKTTGPPTKATISFGTNLKSSRNTMERKKEIKFN